MSKDWEHELFEAVRYNKILRVQELINDINSPNVNFIVPGASGRTLLIAAIGRGHKKIVEILIENDADVNLCDNRDCSPLMMCAYNSYYYPDRFIEITELLLKEGADVNYETYCKDTGRKYTALSCAKNALELGANPKIIDLLEAAKPPKGCRRLSSTERKSLVKEALELEKTYEELRDSASPSEWAEVKRILHKLCDS